MALRKIIIFPDEALRKKANPVKEFDDTLKILTEDMIETMRSAKGIGLAAPQIGVSLRIFVMDFPGENNTKGGQSNKNGDVTRNEMESDDINAITKKPVVVVNPEIKLKEGKIEWEEGCLSFPGIYQNIVRSEHVVVEAQNIYGEKFTIDGKGLIAVILQHEIDHLDGILIFDYMSYLRKKIVKRELKKSEKSIEEREDKSLR